MEFALIMIGLACLIAFLFYLEKEIENQDYKESEEKEDDS